MNANNLGSGRITTVRIVPLPKPASGFVAQDDGTIGMAVNAPEAREVAALLLRIAGKLDGQPERPDDLGAVLAQLPTQGSA